MTGSSPDNSIGIVIQYDGDVLVSLLVARLIYADAYKTVQPAGSVRFDFIECTGYAAPHGLPINTHILRYSTLGEMFGKPSDCEIKVLGKAAAGIGPGNIGYNAAVFRTSDALGITFEMDEHPSEVKASPSAIRSDGKTVLRTFPAAYRASAFRPSCRPHLQIQVLYPEQIFVDG
jgi:hypothetical protein